MQIVIAFPLYVIAVAQVWRVLIGIRMERSVDEPIALPDAMTAALGHFTPCSECGAVGGQHLASCPVLEQLMRDAGYPQTDAGR